MSHGLLIVDMQIEFLSLIDKEERKELIDNTIKTIRHSEDNNIPVFFIEFGNMELDYYSYTLPEITKAAKDYQQFTKYKNNAFEESGLNTLLNKRGIDNIILAGINADACVKKTAREALSNNYKIITSPYIIKDFQTKPAYYLRWYENNTTLFYKHKELSEYISTAQ